MCNILRQSSRGVHGHTHDPMAFHLEGSIACLGRHAPAKATSPCMMSESSPFCGNQPKAYLRVLSPARPKTYEPMSRFFGTCTGSQASSSLSWSRKGSTGEFWFCGWAQTRLLCLVLQLSVGAFSYIALNRSVHMVKASHRSAVGHTLFKAM